jgi:queuine/archaeosine tRNA-ribosyltransferase
VARAVDPLLIAVPERELGESIRACAAKIGELRRELNRALGKYLPIHVLGTGNPLSILAYTRAGADSFDGLDWCQTVSDQETGRLYHSLQLDFFADQSGYSAATEMSYMTRVLGHNLEFYNRWMEMIQDAMTNKTIEALLDKYLPRLFLQNLRNDLRTIEQ